MSSVSYNSQPIISGANLPTWKANVNKEFRMPSGLSRDLICCDQWGLLWHPETSLRFRDYHKRWGQRGG